MKRIWSIEEQVIEDNSTKLRLEFTSVHSEEMSAGNEAPGNDETVMLRLYTSDRNRVAIFKLERNGRFIRADIDTLQPAGGPDPETGEMSTLGEPQSRDDQATMLAKGEHPLGLSAALVQPYLGE